MERATLWLNYILIFSKNLLKLKFNFNIKPVLKIVKIVFIITFYSNRDAELVNVICICWCLPKIYYFLYFQQNLSAIFKRCSDWDTKFCTKKNKHLKNYFFCGLINFSRRNFYRAATCEATNKYLIINCSKSKLKKTFFATM